VFWCYVFGVAAGTNGHQEKKDDEPEKETEENAEPAENLEESVKEQTSSEIAEPADAKEVPIEDSKEVSIEDAKEIPVEDSEQENNKDSSIETQQPSKESTEQDASVDPASQNEEDSDNKVLIITWLQYLAYLYSFIYIFSEVLVLLISLNFQTCFQQDASSGQKQPISASDTTTQRIEVPSNKVCSFS
jgi:hypothetical protein